MLPSLGPQEILVLLFCALGPACITVAVVLLVVSQTRRPGQHGGIDRMAALEEENQRLREELARLKNSEAIRGRDHL